ncbi:hypothetical protein H4Q26_002386 [Puccinia striiformis f. sp. tritici PST-130]|nr:hypothetical protein H4Q26_002386 [Puccinia striiformis f. sp. tritici PST-130]
MLVQLRLVVNLFMYDTIPSSVGECKTKSSTNLGLKLHLSYGSEIVPLALMARDVAVTSSSERHVNV